MPIATANGITIAFDDRGSGRVKFVRQFPHRAGGCYWLLERVATLGSA